MSSPFKNFRNIMKLEEIRGQKVLSSLLPPEDSRRIEIFAKNIPNNLDENLVCTFFELVGPVHTLRLMMDKNNCANRGFAYITYLNSEDAERALRILDGKEIINNFPVSVTLSMNNCRIFLGGIPVRKTKDEVWQELQKNAINNIVDVIMYRSYNNRAHNRGFVFVEFPSHQYAAKMRNKMKGMCLWNCEIIVDWSVPEVPVPEEEMMKVKILYLRNLNVMESRDYLKAVVENYVNPQHVEKVYKFKNYAFIHLVSRGVAEELLNLLTVHYRNTPVEVTFAKPPSEYTKPGYRKQILSKVSKSDMTNNEAASHLSGSSHRCTSHVDRKNDVQSPPQEIRYFNSSHPNAADLFGSRAPSYFSTFQNLSSYKNLTPPSLGNKVSLLPSNIQVDNDVKRIMWSDLVKTDYEANNTLDEDLFVLNRPEHPKFIRKQENMSRDLFASIDPSYLNFESDLRRKKDMTMKQEADQEFGFLTSSPQWRPKKFQADLMDENQNTGSPGPFRSFENIQGSLQNMNISDGQESLMVDYGYSKTSQYSSWGNAYRNQSDRSLEPLRSIENIPPNRMQNPVFHESSLETDNISTKSCDELTFDHDYINQLLSD